MIYGEKFFVNKFYNHKIKLMADIHVETKKNNTIPAWVWILITLAVVALVVFLLSRNNSTTNENTGVNNSKATSYVYSDAIEHYIG
jgi:bacteriorhodopsin